MIGELYDGEFDNFPREDGIISKETSCVVEKDEDGNIHILSQEETGDNTNAKAASSKTDAVNHPDHYKIGDIECIDVMLATQGVDAVINFCICNSFKYIYRHVNKNGLEDIRKAKWYLDKALELIDSRKDKCGTSK